MKNLAPENEKLTAVKRHSYKEMQSTPPQKWKFEKSHGQELIEVQNQYWQNIKRKKQQMK